MTFVVLTSAKNGFAGIGTGPTGVDVGDGDALIASEGLAEGAGEAIAVAEGDAVGEAVGVGEGVGVGALV